MVFVSFFACLNFKDVKRVKANEYDNSIVLNDENAINDDGMQGDYIIINPIDPSTIQEDDNKEEETKVTVVFIVTGICLFAVISLIFIAGVTIAIAYVKFTKAMGDVDKVKNSFFGKVAIKAAKASGQPVAAGIATAVEKAPTAMFNKDNMNYNSSYYDDYDDENDEEYEY